jgi:hypothetical protein
MGIAAFVYGLMAFSAQPAAPEDAPPIVVTGRRLSDTEAALRACLARKCPPGEDIDASLAHAENQFVAGDYREARSTLRASLRRNRKQARAYPEPVSDLFRANALVAAHLGFDDDYIRSTWGILESLEKGIPEPDARHFGARMEIAAMTARTRGAPAAEAAYAELARDSERAGRPDIAAIARLRGAGLAYRQMPSGENRRRLVEIARSASPETRVASLMAKLFLARIARQEGKAGEADALLREVAAGGFKTPVLIHSPPYELLVREMAGASDRDVADQGAGLAARGNPARRFGGNFEKTWIDVGFWVQPNGRVSHVEILRRKGDPDWAAPLLRAIGGRLYAPAREPAYRLERYSYTAGYEAQTGTRIRQRSPRARVEYLDLTAAPEPAAP